jgi:hypothetical protein
MGCSYGGIRKTRRAYTTKSKLKKELEALRGQLSARYTVTHEPWVKDPAHVHDFKEWELISNGGVAFCEWKCGCGLTVAQALGERLRPLKVPEILEKYQEWRED